MNKLIYLLYFAILILFLLLVRKIIFKKEGFHLLHEARTPDVDDGNAAPADNAGGEEVPGEDPTANPGVVPGGGIPANPNVVPGGSTPANPGVVPGEDTLPGPGEDVDADADADDQDQEIPEDTPTGNETTNPAAVTTKTINEQSGEADSLIDILGSDTPKLTVVTDKECCGITIFDVELDPIGKCVSQHIKPSGSDDNPLFVDWKESDNECKNPHRILSRTSNCSEIVNKYDKNIQTLFDLIKQNKCAKCDYIRYLQNADEVANTELTDNEKLYIFKRKIDCDKIGKYKRRMDVLQIGEEDNIKIEVDVPECITPEEI